MKTKKENQNSLLKGLVLGGLMAGALPVAANANTLFNYDNLGSGAEVRSNLLDLYGSPLESMNPSSSDFIVGEGKCGEGKCGEGKCGSKEEAKKETTKEAKKSETKSATEAKCGEGKCGEGKCGSEETKTEKKTTEEKTSEQKCGEGKCGS
ncbi:hypothetical protein DMA11_07115 [Marinilabiliaceae bacterium JC017]|nr:hypothetical protein DMA11_07115 [Marinilabiliaceae bacterium JC017]